MKRSRSSDSVEERFISEPHSTPEASPLPLSTSLDANTQGASDATEQLSTLERLMHKVPRSDMLQIKQCRLNSKLCAHAVHIFKRDFTEHPLKKLTLQVGCNTQSEGAETDPANAKSRKPSGGFQLFFPLIFHHKLSLKELDLSRNDLCSADIDVLCDGLGISSAPHLRVLDISYNSRVGNSGAVRLLSEVRNNECIRAVLMRCVGIDDEGALSIAHALRCRPPPSKASAGNEMSSLANHSEDSFLVNLNENRIGSVGSYALGRKLPSYISLSVCRQVVSPRGTGPRK